MRKVVTPVAAVLLALACVVPAQAERWIWYPVKGGAVAVDQDSRKTDAAEGRVAANTLIFYEQARPVEGETFNFIAERLEFECRGDRHRWSQSAVLDLNGYVVRARPDGDWVGLGSAQGSAALFKRMLCQGDTLPNGKEAADLDAVVAALSVTASKTPRVDLDALAFSTPRPAPPAAAAPSPAPKTAPPRSPPPPPDPGPAPPPVPQPKAVTTPVAAPTPPPAVVAAPPGQTVYASAPRCIEFKRQENRGYSAVNACPYRVNYAWCVSGGTDPAVECGPPFIARVSSAVPPNAQTASTYLGGVGRMHVFACRAPGTPMVREAEGRFEHQCLGPATASPPAQAKTPPAKAPSAQPGPQLRR